VATALFFSDASLSSILFAVASTKLLVTQSTSTKWRFTVNRYNKFNLQQFLHHACLPDERFYLAKAALQPEGTQTEVV